MDYGLVTATAPATEPVSLAEAKTHLRIDHDDEDALITGWIQAAREYAEAHTGRRFVTQELTLTLHKWPCEWVAGVYGAIRLPVEPVASVDAVIYREPDGDSVTLTANTHYQVWLSHSPPLIAPAPNTVWPQLELNRLNPITVEFTAGVAGGSVPEVVRTAILLTLANWDENRAGENILIAHGLPPAAKRLLDTHWTGDYR